MKRRILWLVVVTAILCLAWSTAAIGECEHARFCNGETCLYCGEAYIGEKVMHSYGEPASDEESHWYECSFCSLVVDKEKHWRFCYEEVCAVCKLAYTGDAYYHGGNIEWHGDESGHWSVCLDCENRVDEVLSHWKYCTGDVCETCGLAFENGYTEHGNLIWDYDDMFHWNECEDCGMLEMGMHNRHCQQDVCADCGMPYTGDSVWHEGKWFSDDTYHWYECTLCGNVTERYDHWRWCNEDVCAECNVQYNGDIISHGDIKWSSDGMSHWYDCSICGQSSEKEEHYRWCYENFCSNCGAEYNGENLWHELEIQADENGHWWLCNVCGLEEDKYEHWRWCSEEVCAECAVAYTGNRTEHYQVDWNGDDKYHWFSCTVCEFASQKNTHWRWCDEDVCVECRKAYTGDDTSHYDITWSKDESRHWYSCSLCGFTSGKGVHWRWCDDEVCAECQTAYTGEVTEHYSVEWMNDEMSHWYKCTSCGYETEKAEHWRWCDQSICCGCEVPYTGDEIVHMDPDWSSDEASHWFTCTICGHDSDKTEHERFCTEKKCFDCGHAYEGENAFHISCEVKDTEDGVHISVCYDCGYSECYRYCDAEFCWACGKEYTGDEIKHYEGEWVVIEEATSEKEGLKEMRCNFCGFLMETEVIPKLEEEEKVVHGDVSGDGMIDGRDLLRLAKFIGGYAVDIDEKNASVNGDSVIDGRDLLRLAKFIGGYDVELK